jgi:putative endonuclease
MMNERLMRYETGLSAERFAALILRLKGYRILARRYKTPVGEIDLIAGRGKMLAFIEVKARLRLEDALAATTPAMRQRIVRAAYYFIAGHPMLAEREMCFDLIAFRPPFYWRHLDNAWRPAA